MSVKFTLEIEMDDSDGSLLADYGISEILTEYLDKVRERVYLGNTDSGVVLDVNGNRIGSYRTEEKK